MKSSTIALVIALVLAVAASFLAGYIMCQRHYEKSLKQADTVIKVEWKRDTIYEPKDSIIYKVKPVYLAVHDTTEISDTVTVRDSVLVEVPITEKTYTGENYRAVVRGFEPELVDIWVKQRTITITRPYREHWAFTVGPQAGYGITPKGLQPYAGIGVTFGYTF